MYTMHRSASAQRRTLFEVYLYLAHVLSCSAHSMPSFERLPQSKITQELRPEVLRRILTEAPLRTPAAPYQGEEDHDDDGSAEAEDGGEAGQTTKAEVRGRRDPRMCVSSVFPQTVARTREMFNYLRASLPELQQDELPDALATLLHYAVRPRLLSCVGSLWSFSLDGLPRPSGGAGSV